MPYVGFETATADTIRATLYFNNQRYRNQLLVYSILLHMLTVHKTDDCSFAPCVTAANLTNPKKNEVNTSKASKSKSMETHKMRLLAKIYN
jgi:hypothetical protein